MNKMELCKKVQESSKSELTLAQVTEVLNCIIDTVKETVKNGNEVQLVGFGTFKSTVRAERECINPATGERIKVPSKRVPKFKPGKAFSEELL